jgi:hypothetical protein
MIIGPLTIASSTLSDPSGTGEFLSIGGTQNNLKI